MYAQILRNTSQDDINDDSRLRPRIIETSSSLSPASRKIAICWSNTSRLHPRGKKVESVPNSTRCAPITSTACRKAVAGVCEPARYFAQLPTPDVSVRTLGD